MISSNDEDNNVNSTSSRSLNDQLQLCSRSEFRNMYEHILSIGHDVYSLQYATRVDHENREAYEADSRRYYAEHYPDVNYQGIMIRDGNDGSLKKQAEKPFYYPLARVEPVEGNTPAIDLDVYETSSATIEGVLASWEPTLSPGIKLLQDDDPNAYSVYLVHPGANTSILAKNQGPPHSVTSAVIRIPDLLKRAGRKAITNLAVYIYDLTDETTDPSFLGAMKILQGSEAEEVDRSQLETVKATPYVDAVHSGDAFARIYTKELQIVDRRWSVVCVPLDDSHSSSRAFIFVGFAVIIVAFLLLAWITFIRAKAETEKAFMTSQQIDRERQLNEYLVC